MEATTISGILGVARTTVITPLITLLILAATVLFIWGVIKYVLLSSGDTKKAGEARQFMLWGVIGLFTIVAMWGLVLVLQKTFNLGPNANTQDSKIPDWEDVPR